MTKKQKALLETAKICDERIAFERITFRYIYIINSGKNYDGFWGKNGFRQILIVGETSRGERYKIDCNQYDILNIYNKTNISLMFDVSKDNDCLRLWVDDPHKIIVQNAICSTLVLEVVK